VEPRDRTEHARRRLIVAKVADIASAIVFVALVGVLVRNKNTAGVVKSFGDIFTGSLRVAEGATKAT